MNSRKPVSACLLAGALILLSATAARAESTRYEAELSPAVCTGTIAGIATVGIRFANGTTVRSPSFDGMGAWSTWSTQTFAVSVNQGGNTIRLNPTTSAGGFKLGGNAVVANHTLHNSWPGTTR